MCAYVCYVKFRRAFKVINQSEFTAMLWYYNDETNLDSFKVLNKFSLLTH